MSPVISKINLLIKSHKNNQGVVGDLEFIMTKIKENKSNDGQTLLHYAIEEKVTSVVELLIADKTVDLNFKDHNGRTPLHYAVAVNNEDIIKLLVNEGVNIDLQDKRGRTPLHYAIAVKNEDIIKLLVNEGVNIDLQDEHGRTPLHYAVAVKNEDIIKLLVNEEVNIDHLPDKDGRTPLHHAALKGCTSIVMLLINEGAKVDAHDNKGYIPLHHAVNRGHKSVVELLINEGDKKHNSKEPLYFADLRTYKKTDVHQFLTKKIADINTQGNCDETPLHIAVKKGHTEIVQLLINCSRINIHIHDKDGNTPLDYARKEEYSEIVKLLTSKEASNGFTSSHGLSIARQSTGEGTLLPKIEGDSGGAADSDMDSDNTDSDDNLFKTTSHNMDYRTAQLNYEEIGEKLLQGQRDEETSRLQSEEGKVKDLRKQLQAEKQRVTVTTVANECNTVKCVLEVQNTEAAQFDRKMNDKIEILAEQIKPTRERHEQATQTTKPLDAKKENAPQLARKKRFPIYKWAAILFLAASAMFCFKMFTIVLFLSVVAISVSAINCFTKPKEAEKAISSHVDIDSMEDGVERPTNSLSSTVA